MRVGGELNAIGEAAPKIVHEDCCGLRVTCADVPARNKLRVGVDGRPRPDVSPAVAGVLFGQVLRLAAYEAPNLIALEPLAREIAQRLILVDRAGAAGIGDKLQHGVERHAGHLRGCADAVPLDQTREELDALFGAELVHGRQIVALCLSDQDKS